MGLACIVVSTEVCLLGHASIFVHACKVNIVGMLVRPWMSVRLCMYVRQCRQVRKAVHAC
jgi:hypothetical protein